MGKIATNIVASGNDWKVGDVLCTSGPQDRPYEEQHETISIAVVLAGSFRYRSALGSEILSPGSLLLGNFRQTFDIGFGGEVEEAPVVLALSGERFLQVLERLRSSEVVHCFLPSEARNNFSWSGCAFSS